MAYDDELAARYRSLIDGLPGLSEKRMFGGLCFFLDGNMIGGARRTKTGERRLMFRIGTDNEAALENLSGGTVMEMGGRRMHGFYFVDADAYSDEQLKDWVSLAVGHALSLPPK